MWFSFQQPSNRFMFERVECEMFNYVANHSCYAKMVARDTISVDFFITPSQPMRNLKLHSVFYYRFNPHTYSKFLVDHWEDLCGYLSGRKSSPLLDVAFKLFGSHSNMNHSCPYNESIKVVFKDYELKKFIIEPLLPAGRFRLDNFYYGGGPEKLIASVKVYFAISDHRIWH